MTAQSGTDSLSTSAAEEGAVDTPGRLPIGVVTTVVSVGFLVMAFQLQVGTLARPGPGIGPLVFGVVALAGGLTAVGQAVAGGALRNRASWPTTRSINWRLVGFVAALLATAAAMPIVGYVVTAAVLAIVVMLLVGQIAWWKTVLYGCLIAAVTSYVFTGLFGVPLPTGIFFVLGDWS